MISNLLNHLDNELMLGLLQAAVAIALCGAVVVVCRWFAVDVRREATISIARGLVQMIFVGLVLAVLLHGTLWLERSSCWR